MERILLNAKRTRTLHSKDKREEDLRPSPPLRRMSAQGLIKPSLRKPQGFRNKRNFGERIGRTVSTTKDEILGVPKADLIVE